MLKASSPSGGNVSVAAKALLLPCAVLPTCASEVVLSMSHAKADAGRKTQRAYPAALGEIQPAAPEPTEASGRTERQHGAASRATDLRPVNSARAGRRARRMRENMPAPREETEGSGEAPSR